MLGSLQDAEDAVQETLLRAWRSLDGFAGRGSVRNWFYKIATNVCLNALSSRVRERRVLPETIGPPARQTPEGGPATEIAWLEPYPDRLLDSLADTAPGPHALYERRETVEFAFVAAIQHLPPRQRAALLLCDVLGWSAGEAAELLEASAASVNSALQRARATLSQRRTTEHSAAARPLTTGAQNELLERYMRAWEETDIENLAALLRDDAVLSMPPWRQWFSGREAVRAFFERAWNSGAYGGFRLARTAANRKPAYAAYSRGQEEGALWRAHSLHLLGMDEAGIAKITLYVDPLGPKLFPAFGLSDTHPHNLEKAVHQET
jgi:RNA polymerase sigma-70 factor (ECF subfamily)